MEVDVTFKSIFWTTIMELLVVDAVGVYSFGCYFNLVCCWFIRLGSSTMFWLDSRGLHSFGWFIFIPSHPFLGRGFLWSWLLCLCLVVVSLKFTEFWSLWPFFPKVGLQVDLGFWYWLLVWGWGYFACCSFLGCGFFRIFWLFLDMVNFWLGTLAFVKAILSLS